MPIDEEDAKAPINPYGASKLMTERMLADASAAHPFNYGALRYFNVSGADSEKGRTGTDRQGLNPPHQGRLRDCGWEAAEIAVYGTDYPTADGTCIRDYIHVSDLADAHVAALNWLVEHPDDNLVVNCGYGKGLSVLEVLDAVDRHTNLPLKRVMEGRRAGDQPELSCRQFAAHPKARLETEICGYRSDRRRRSQLGAKARRARLGSGNSGLATFPWHCRRRWSR